MSSRVASLPSRLVHASFARLGVGGLALALALAAISANAATSGKPATTRSATKPAAKTPVKRPAARPASRPTTRPTAKPAAEPPAKVAGEARAYAELGAYGKAADELRGLRRRIAPDGDLELMLALYEARSGDVDSAAARLWGPVLTAALGDTLPASRRHRYAWQPEAEWINGRFDGWSWYVARARAEVAARRGRWPEALDAARLAVAAHPLAGEEWLILAIAAARAGRIDEARTAGERAVFLDPSLPEAHHLAGLFAWREGRRSAAQARFREAIALDSTYRAPALALVRTRLPSVPPDTLPAELVTGVREVTLLTSPARPKEEEFQQMDSPATIVLEMPAVVPDSLRGTFKEAHLALGVFIDERGRIGAHDLPWFDATLLPEAMLSRTLADLPQWRFTPAMRSGVPNPVWSNVQIVITP